MNLNFYLEEMIMDEKIIIGHLSRDEVDENYIIETVGL